MTAALAWLGVILLAWTAGCGVIWALYLRAERRRAAAAEGRIRDEIAADAARRRAQDRARREVAADAAKRLADLVDEEYRALCERDDGRG